MSTPYAGDPLAGFPSSIPIPDDGDLKNAATVGAALEGLMDGIVAIALIHTGTNPAGTLKNPTLKGNVTYTNDGANKTHSAVNVNWSFDNQCNFAISGPASASPAITVDRHATITGNWDFVDVTSFKDSTILDTDGHLVYRPVHYLAGDSDQVIAVTGANRGDVHMLRLGEFGSDHKGIVQNGTRIGQRVRVVSFEPVHRLQLYHQDAATTIGDPNTSNVSIIAVPTAPGDYSSVLLQWSGAAWEWIGQ